MDRLEQLVRDTLAERAGRAPSDLSGQSRTRARRWAAAVAVAAVVAGVAIGVATVTSDAGNGRHVAEPTPRPVNVPSGYKPVSYHGIEFAVPSMLSVVHANTCGPLWADTVLTEQPGVVLGCAAGGNPQPRAGAVYAWAVQPGADDATPANRLATKATTVAGHPARTGYGTLPGYPGVTGVLILPDPGVQLTVTAPTRAVVATILGSVRLAPMDAVGCPSREPTLAENAVASSLAPAGASAIALCGYAGFATDHNSDFWLIGSATAPASRVKALLAQLDALPAGKPAGARSLHDYVRLSYPDGRVRWLSMSMAGSSPELGFSDGQRTKVAGENTRASKALYPSISWPESVFPQPSPSPAPPDNPTTATAPAGYRLVSYDGIELAVPDDLPVTHSPCTPPVNAVFAATGGVYSCPAHSPGQSTPLPATAIGVWLGPLAPDDKVARTREPTGRRTVAGVPVTVTAPTRAQVDTILDSIRTVTVDELGCPARPASISPSGQPSSAPFVPTDPSSAVVCEFSPIGPYGGYRQVGSYRLAASKLADLVATLDALPERAARDPGAGPSGYDWIVFAYPDGRTHTVGVQTTASPSYITDGNRTVEDAQSRVSGFLRQ